MKNFPKKFAPAVVCATLALSACKKPEPEAYSEKVPPIEQVQEGTQEKITNIVSETIDASGRKKEDMVNTVSAALSESEKELEKTLKQIEETPVVTQINEVKDAWQNIAANPTSTVSPDVEDAKKEDIQKEDATKNPEDVQNKK